MDKLKLILTRDSECTSANIKDIFEINKENDGGFILYKDEVVCGEIDSAKSSSWKITAEEAKQLADFLSGNLNNFDK